MTSRGSVMQHGDMPLSATTLLDMAGERVYAQGEHYGRFVRGLRMTGVKAYASVQAKQVYTVELDWSGSRLDGYCTCQHQADGNLCKHLVAVGLAAIDTSRVQVDDPSAAMIRHDYGRRPSLMKALAAKGL